MSMNGGKSKAGEVTAQNGAKKSDNTAFLRIPKVLLAPEYRAVSIEAKFLYSLILDRMSLSVKNGWFDELGSFVYFTVINVTEYIHCSRDKARKLFNELIEVGLIKRVKRGCGRPAKIYLIELEKEAEIQEDKKNSSQKSNINETEKSDVKPKNQTGEGEKSVLKKARNQSSRRREISPQEGEKSVPNNTEYNNTDYSNTEYNNTEYNNLSKTECFNNQSINQYVNEKSKNKTSHHDRRPDGFDGFEEAHSTVIQKIKKQIDYETLIHTNDRETVDNIVNVMAEVMLVDKPYYEINKHKIPKKLVQLRFKQITYKRLDSFLIAFSDISYRIKNPKGYLITALYNLSMTAGASLQNRVRSDMAACPIHREKNDPYTDELLKKLCT